MLKLISALLMMLVVCTGCGSKTKESLNAEGVKQLKASNPGAAVVYFKNALERDGNYVEARFNLAKAYAALGKLDQGEREYSKVLTQDPARDEVQLELAKLYNALGKPEKALVFAGKYLARHPDHVETLEEQASAQVLEKRYPQAEELLRKVLSLDPQRAKARLSLAGVYISMGKGGEGEVLLDQLLQSNPKNVPALYMRAAYEMGRGKSEKAAPFYLRIVKADPSQTLAQYKLGVIRIQTGDLAGAETLADQIVKNFPKKGDGYRLKGLVAFRKKNFTEAIASLQNSLKLGPTPEGYHFLGLCYYNTGELESALSQFRVILDKIPDARQARLMTGQILLAQKRGDDAVVEIKKVIAADEKDALAHELLGGAYMAQGHFEEGMRELNRATALDAKMVTAHLKKGYFYFSRGNNSEGELELATAVRSAPDILNSRLLLASYYLRLGKSAQAIKLIKEGLTGGKGDAPLYNALAAVNFLSGNKPGGLDSLENAKRVDPSFLATYHNLAIYYVALGENQKATTEYQSVLRIDPQNVRALLGLATLQEVRGKDQEAFAYYQKATETRSPEAFLALAAYHLKKQAPDRALKVLDDASKVAPRAVGVLEMKGRILLESKKFREALRTFDEVEALDRDAGATLKIGAYVAMQEDAKAVELARRLIARHPSSAKGYLLLATIYQRQKDLRSATIEIQNGIRVDGQNIEARLFLGRLHEGNREYDKAMTCYQDALRIQPESVPALFARGSLLDQTGRKKEAVAVYRLILEKTETFAPALNNLAYLSAEGYGSPEEALRLALDAFKLEPGNAGVMDTVGYALLKNGRKADALKMLERAVSLLPNEPAVRYHLALAYKETGDRIRAEQSLQKSLALGGGADTAAVRSLLFEMKRH